ncbi:MAG: DUF58 domain-containing protein [Micropruina sp.]|nr:DUF58 domain-containing protein [Micropruina sp.]
MTSAIKSRDSSGGPPAAPPRRAKQRRFELRLDGATAALRPGLGAARRRLTDAGRRVRQLSGPVLAPLAPIMSAITPLGRWALGTSLVAVIAGLWLGWAELLGLALVLSTAVLAGVGFIFGRPSYQVTVNLASLRVVVGEHAVGDIVVRSASDRSVAPSVIELPVGRAIASFPVPRLAPGQEHEELFTIPTQRRAVLPLGPVRSVRQDPLELLRREVAWTEPGVIYVHPRTARLDNASTGLIRDLEGLATKDLSNDDVSFHALREYVPGDDLRNVHWRSTARTSKLMIRQFEETRRSQFVILLDTRLADYGNADEFELGISIAASLSRSAHADGKDVTVYSTDAKLLGPTPAGLLDSYAGIEPNLGREPYGDRARIIAADAPAASVVALVAGSATPLEQLRLAAVRVPPTARCFGIRAAIGEELALKRVRDFALVSVPSLDELALAARVVTA